MENLPSAMEVHLAAVFKDKNPGTRRDFFASRAINGSRRDRLSLDALGSGFQKFLV